MLMEDKRILRTKAQFRQALITLLDQKRFEQITIKALCDQAGITRITFYAHYADKYELAEDIFREMIVLGTQEYLQLQRKNNPSDDPILGYCNVLDAILDLYTTRFDFFAIPLRRKIPTCPPPFSPMCWTLWRSTLTKPVPTSFPGTRSGPSRPFCVLAWAALSRRTPPLTATPGSRPGPSCAISSLLIF